MIFTTLGLEARGAFASYVLEWSNLEMLSLGSAYNENNFFHENNFFSAFFGLIGFGLYYIG